MKSVERLSAILAGLIIAWTQASAEALAAKTAESVSVWQRWETSFQADADPNTELVATLTSPSGKRRRVRGFFDGGNTWRVRFMPDEPGAWRFRTTSQPPRAGLDGQQGRFLCRAATGNTRFLRHGAIRVSAGGHHFEHADGTPFLWLVDTAWNGALKSTRRDWERYLDNRAAKGFTGVQFVVTQWRTAYTNAEGQVAYTGSDKIAIRPELFRRIDQRVDAVGAKGLLAVPVLLWTLGQRQHNPGQLPESQAIRLARYMVARYGANHVAWFLPGDGNYFGERADRWKRIGRAVFDTGDHAPVFLHPQGMQWPYDAFLGERWLSAFGYQSGHGDDDRTLAWLHSGPPALKWSRKPIRPVINLEPPYEDHVAYQSRQRHTDYSVRRALYWSMLNAPTAGTSYGAHGVWSWESTPKEPQEHGGTGVAKPWFEAMDLPGSFQLKHLSDLFTSLRWWQLRPDPGFARRVGEKTPRRALTHVVYTRDRKGTAALYLDGRPVADRRIAGSCENWDGGFRLALANELTGDRPWLGEYRRVALLDHALSAEQIARRFQAGVTGRSRDAIVLYKFTEGKGNTIRDSSGAGAPVNLTIADPSAVKWLPGGGLAVRSSVLIASEQPAIRLTGSLKKSQAVTIEAWVTPANLQQAGPGEYRWVVPVARPLRLGAKGPRLRGPLPNHEDFPQRRTGGVFSRRRIGRPSRCGRALAGRRSGGRLLSGRRCRNGQDAGAAKRMEGPVV